VIGGGYVFDSLSGVPAGASVSTNAPQNTTTWAVTVKNTTASPLVVAFHAEAICAS
jgi:hypothetical protein